MLLLQTSCNAESTVVQTKMTAVLKLMLNAQVYHTRDLTSIKLVQNSLSAETHTLVTFGEEQVMANGDH
jgi:hypothetical protein